MTLLRYLLVSFLSLIASAQTFGPPKGRSEARAPVISKGGIASSNQVIASQVGAQILARGGSAVDAAIAMNAALGVIEPMMAGPGGDLFALVRDAKTGTLTGLNASGWAPAGLSIEYLRSKGLSRMPTAGIHSVTVPGCVDGWAQLHRRFGRLPWKLLFEPAIYLAEHGYPVSAGIANVWRFMPKVCRDPACVKLMLPNGDTPRMGDFRKNHDLARALRLIAQDGAGAFYRGQIADAILRTSDRLGGTLVRADLEQFRSQWVTPLSATYSGWTVYQIPPNSRGIAVLEMLKLLETFGRSSTQLMNAQQWHRRIEAMRLAYADIHHVGDPAQGKGAAEEILRPAYIARRVANIDPERARCDVHPGDLALAQGETTSLAVIDSEGNSITLIQSLANGMSGVVADGMGFILQNRGLYFSLNPSEPNSLAPRKRPAHTLMPAVLEKNGQHISFSFVGGPIQGMAQMQVISNVADFGMDLQSALEAPRFFSYAQGPQCDVNLENRVPSEIREGLERLGHRISVSAEYNDMAAIGQAVMWDRDKDVKHGASDPRGDGAAIPEPLPVVHRRRAREGLPR